MVAPDTGSFRPLAEDIRTAASMAEALVREWRRTLYETRAEDRHLEMLAPDTNTPLKLDDILNQLVLVAEHCRYFLLRLGKFPCVEWKSGEMPICSVNEFFGSEKDARDYKVVEKNAVPRVAHKLLREFRDKFMSRKDHPMMVSPAKGEGFLSDGLKSFMTTRVTASRLNPVSPLPQPGPSRKGSATSYPARPTLPPAMSGIFNDGLVSVEVECKPTGRRIHYAPAYFVNWTYFGPSPRAIEWLPPGRYVFAIDGKKNDFLPDPAVFSIPTQFNPVLKRF